MTTVDKPSPRQLEMLALVANGLTREEIGKQMFISPLTVRNKLLEARSRMEASNITHTIVLCVARGYLGVDGRDEAVYVPTPFVDVVAAA